MHEFPELPTPPPNKRHLFTRTRLTLAVVLVIMLLAGFAYVGREFFQTGHDHSELSQADVKYICPMHPAIVDNKPGSCPICGMDLVKIENEESARESKVVVPVKDDLDDLFGDSSDSKSKSSEGRTILFYRNPMDPTITSHTPDKDEMGMDYIPVYSDEFDPSAPPVEGMATIRLGEDALRLTGVQTAKATNEVVARSVRTVGIVVPDETRIRHVHTKVDGWIETLYTNFTGQIVTMDQPLLSIYSPELLASQEEFLAARAAAVKFTSSSSPDVKTLGKNLLLSARKRLELFDVPEKVIDELERTGAVQRTVTLDAPVSGFVTSKGIYEGQQIEPGLELFTITDLSQVWIEADLYEY
ncbi:MAG: efflux RND transporter periplasmic adaptor subunit, partial [Desulfobulbaceae bacterium]|nr:efflux RND transporter periplasmic adaptor subunit [Desulfobulbaceae bacterium]